MFACDNFDFIFRRIRQTTFKDGQHFISALSCCADDEEVAELLFVEAIAFC